MIASLGSHFKNIDGSERFDWTEQRLSARPLIIGETTQADVVQRLMGPALHISGDGGDPHQLCYLQQMADGMNVRIVLSFFGTYGAGVLAAIELETMTHMDPWTGRICRRPILGSATNGLDSGIRLGVNRSTTRRILGPPTKRSSRQDNYSNTFQSGGIDGATQLTLRFARRNSLVRLEARRVETK